MELTMNQMMTCGGLFSGTGKGIMQTKNLPWI